MLSATVAVFAAGSENRALADEGGTSVWLLGSYATQAAVPAAPGLSIETNFYSAASFDHPTGLTSDGRVRSDRSIYQNYFIFTPSYAFDTPVLGGQLEIGLSLLAGNYSSNIATSLVTPSGPMPTGATADSSTAFGDVFPIAAVKWAHGVHNFMVYAAGNIPLGGYDSNRQASVGLGYWAIDGGAGYTYFDQDKGHEFSAVLGLTYNFINPYTAYQSGIDMHLELSASQYVTDRLALGVAAYVYDQLTADSGPGATQGPFMSRVVGVGPQFEYDFALGGRTTTLSARSYYEFAGQNRAQGWGAWLNLIIEFGQFGR